VLDGVYLPLSRAVAAVITLNVDPGGYSPWVTRSSSGPSLACSARSQAGVPSTAAFGLKVGQEASATTLPVEGTRAKAAPGWPVALSPLKAAACTAGSSEVTTSLPFTVPPVIEWNSRASTPERSELEPVR